MIVLNLKKEDIKFTKHKNGNNYATIVVEKRKEVDKYDNTHTVYNGQTATERAEKAKKEYCGNGKEYVWSPEGKNEFKTVKVTEIPVDGKDLPF
jgi:hypothetical protein